MLDYLALGLAWLLLPLPFAIFLGKCIGVGQAGEWERHAAEAETTAAPLQPGAVGTADHGTSLSPEARAMPAQRQPVIPVRNVS